MKFDLVQFFRVLPVHTVIINIAGQSGGGGGEGDRIHSIKSFWSPPPPHHNPLLMENHRSQKFLDPPPQAADFCTVESQF